MSRFRFTLRRMMVIVALAAMLFGIGVWVLLMSHLSDVYRSRAEEFNRAANAVTRGTYNDGKGRLSHVEWPAPNKQALLRLRDKYERAARYPWLAVAPDTD